MKMSKLEPGSYKTPRCVRRRLLGVLLQKLQPIIASAVLLCSASGVSAQSGALDFDYTTFGDRMSVPSLAFNDGRDTFLQMPADLTPTVEGKSVERRGPYWVVRGVHAELSISVSGRQSRVRYVGSNVAAVSPVNAPAMASTPAPCQPRTRTEVRFIEFRDRRALVLPEVSAQLRPMLAALRSSDKIRITGFPDINDHSFALRRARFTAEWMEEQGVSGSAIEVRAARRPRGGVEVSFTTSVPCPPAVVAAASAQAPAAAAAAPTDAKPAPPQAPSAAIAAASPGTPLGSAPIADATSTKQTSGLAVVERVPGRLAEGVDADRVTVLAVDAGDMLARRLRDFGLRHGMAIKWEVDGDFRMRSRVEWRGTDARDVMSKALKAFNLKGWLVKDTGVLVVREIEPVTMHSKGDDK